MVDHLAALFPGEIAVFHLAHVQHRVFEKAGTVRLHRAHMVGVLVGDQNMPDGLGVDAQPAHLLLQTLIVVARVDHDGGVALAVKEDVGHPLPHAGHMLVDPAGIQRFEYLLAAIHPAHFLLLEFRRLFGHCTCPSRCY